MTEEDIVADIVVFDLGVKLQSLRVEFLTNPGWHTKSVPFLVRHSALSGQAMHAGKLVLGLNVPAGHGIQEVPFEVD